MQIKLIFESGKVFKGRIFAGQGERIGEVIFNTAMTGYQEVLTDPSYHGQIVVMTYPLIGNYGINNQDIESRKIFLEAFIVKEYIDFPSNFRSQKSLKEYLNEHNILGIEDMDTRAITKYIRTAGSQKAILTTSQKDINIIIQDLKNTPNLAGRDLVKEVTSPQNYKWNSEKKGKYKVAVIDCGVKFNILRLLTKYGCDCTVFSSTKIKAEEILKEKYDGLFISNGPGDPEPVNYVVKEVRALMGKIPIFGICLGHQIIGLALGGKTYKLKFGHHGANHPVKNMITGEIEITSQNHNFCIDINSLPKDNIEITHINLNDNTVEGLRHKKFNIFCVQYHPEASPGPHDSKYLFEEFIKSMSKQQG